MEVKYMSIRDIKNPFLREDFMMAEIGFSATVIDGDLDGDRKERIRYTKGSNRMVKVEHYRED